MDEIINNRILYLLGCIQMESGWYMGICVNACCGAPKHPHWDDQWWQTVNLQNRPINTNFPPYYNNPVTGLDTPRQPR